MTDESCETETTLFTDSFENENQCGWALYTDSNESAEIDNGVLRMSVATNGVVAWTNPEKTFDDVEISVQTRQTDGPNNNAYGVICRYVDEDNFYIFLISGDGYYAIGKYQTGVNQITYLTGQAPEHYVPSESINQGQTSNQIRVQCVGDTLTMYVNGFLMTEVEDNSFSSGDIGLATSILESGRTTIEFESVQVTAP